MGRSWHGSTYKPRGEAATARSLSLDDLRLSRQTAGRRPGGDAWDTSVRHFIVSKKSLSLPLLLIRALARRNLYLKSIITRARTIFTRCGTGVVFSFSCQCGAVYSHSASSNSLLYPKRTTRKLHRYIASSSDPHNLRKKRDLFTRKLVLNETGHHDDCRSDRH